MIRVLIVDDSAAARHLLSAILGADPDVEIVGEAGDGAAAVEMACRLRPDVVTMDLRMPRMDGFEATKEIMIAAPTPIVIITASMAVREVETTLHALRAGAVSVLAKPAGPDAPGFDEAARQLVAHVKAMAQVKVVRHWRAVKREPNSAGRDQPPLSGPGVRARCVAIATSTGGPAALHALLSDLPGDFPAPILVVQHITHGFTTGLADWLNKVSPLHVKVAETGEPLTPHTVYLAPDNRHLGISAQGKVALSNAAPIGGFRPSGTYLFESVAEAFQASAAAVILTGMGEDGVAGLRAVRKAGGRIIAQDERTSVIFGMPAVAIAAGLADQVLPLDAIARRLVDWVVPV